MQEAPNIILGIDPGSLVMGYGLIAVNKNKVSLVDMGVLELARKQDHAERLQLIFSCMDNLLKQYKVASVAIEAPFFGKNVQSMLKLGRAQGVAIAAAMMNGLQAVEYAPRKVKQAITGRGNASKEQVWQMLQHTLQLKDEQISHFDATDALSVALCHYYQTRLPVAVQQSPSRKKKAPKSSSWESYAALHPDRVVR